MNFLKLTILSLFIVAFSACGKDDDGPVICTQSDWVGVYEGTIDCDGTTEDVNVTITANGAEDIIIVYTTSSVTTSYDPLKPNACELNASGTVGGLSSSIDAMLEGDDLTITEVISGGGTTSTCNLTAKRK